MKTIHRTVIDLIIADALAIVMGIIVIMDLPTAIRLLLGVPFLLFLPGYTLVSVLFPEKNKITAGERMALSFGISIVVAPIIGLILNYTPWGITVHPIVLSIVGFIIVMSITAMIRRTRLPEEERASINFTLRWQFGGSRLNTSLSIVLILSILGAIGTLGYIIAKPNVGESFTEFYILGPEGKADNYPTEFIMSEGAITSVKYGSDADARYEPDSTGIVIIGIVNHENEIASYTLRVVIDGTPVPIYFEGNYTSEISMIELTHNEKWEEQVGFTPQHTGKNQKVEFILYKNNKPTSDKPLHLWIDVRE